MRNLEQIRKFYKKYSNSSSLSTILYNQIPQTLSAELKNQIPRSVTAEFNNAYFELFRSYFNLTWSHYTFLMRIDNEEERRLYEIELEKYNWSVRELKRQ